MNAAPPLPLPSFLDAADARHGKRRLAWLQRLGTSPGLFWLSGLLSDMGSTKAAALAEWAAGSGHAMTRFDYSGHGASSGRFEDGTIGLWLADALAVFEKTQGPQLIIGSSMGGWIALRLVQALRAQQAGSDRIAGLLLIAPAWDMTERLMWAEMSPAARAAVMDEGVWRRPSEYAADGYPITRALIEEGRQHLLPEGPLTLGCPVRILHGDQDADVPFAHSEALMQRLAGSDAQLDRVSGGDHRLSRPEQLARLTALAAGMLGHPA